MTNGFWGHQLGIAGTDCVLFWPILCVVLWYFLQIHFPFDLLAQKEQ